MVGPWEARTNQYTYNKPPLEHYQGKFAGALIHNEAKSLIFTCHVNQPFLPTEIEEDKETVKLFYKHSGLVHIYQRYDGGVEQVHKIDNGCSLVDPHDPKYFVWALCNAMQMCSAAR